MTNVPTFELPRLVCRTSTGDDSGYGYAVLACTPAFAEWLAGAQNGGQFLNRNEELAWLAYNRTDVLACADPNQLVPEYLQASDLDDMTEMHDELEDGCDWRQLPGYCASPHPKYAPKMVAPTTQVRPDGFVRFAWFDPDAASPTEITTPWLELRRVFNLAYGRDEDYDPTADPDE